MIDRKDIEAIHVASQAGQRRERGSAVVPCQVARQQGGAASCMRARAWRAPSPAHVNPLLWKGQ